MEKYLALFRRKPGTTREEYHDHYVNVHSPLGMRLMGGIEGYTVNLVKDGGDDVDAVTEVWTQSVIDLQNGKTFATAEERALVVQDHVSFMGPGDSFVVQEAVLVEGALQPSVGDGAWAKAVLLYGPGEKPGEPPAGAARVVDNRVIRVLSIRDKHAEDGNLEGAPVALIRMVWANDPALLPAPNARTLIVRERVNVVLGA